MENFCGFDDSVAEARGDTRWNKKHLKWWIAADISGITGAAFREVAKVSFKEISSFCALTFEEAQSQRDADIIVRSGWIDGRGGTLAWSQLPPAQPVYQKYDTGEIWSASGPNRGIDLGAVFRHEVGHALGLLHDQRGTGALMEPTYNPRVLHYTKRDIARLQGLYGRATSPPPDDDNDGKNGNVILTLDGFDDILYSMKNGKFEIKIVGAENLK